MTSVDPLDQVTLIMYTCREQKKKSDMSDRTTRSTIQWLLNSWASTRKLHRTLQAALKVVSAILENKLELLSSMLQLSCLQNAYS